MLCLLNDLCTRTDLRERYCPLDVFEWRCMQKRCVAGLTHTKKHQRKNESASRNSK